MHRPQYVLCLLILLCSNVLVPAVALANQTAVPTIGAKGAALMDVDSGRLLYGKNEHVQLPMASTTKIMTAILAIESGRLNELVTVSSNAVKVEPSSIWLVAGEQMSLLHLVYGLMLRSGNDAAIAIAEHLAGSVSAFAELMNAKARELGMVNTNFTNSHGLPDNNHYTTAYDLAMLSAYALRNPQFRAIVSTTRISIADERTGAPRIWYNKNRMLEIYPGADGVKTGWTRAAGHCLVASASRSGQRLVAVVLNSPDDWGETASLLDYGFANYRPLCLFSAGQYIATVEVARGNPPNVGVLAEESFFWPVRKGEQVQLQYLVQLELPIVAPLRRGDRVGYMLVIEKGRTVARIPLVSDQTVTPNWWRELLPGLWKNFSQLLWRGNSQ